MRGRRLEAWNVLQANTIGLLAFILILYFRHQSDFSRLMIFIFYALNVFLEVLARNLVYRKANSTPSGSCFGQTAVSSEASENSSTSQAASG